MIFDPNNPRVVGRCGTCGMTVTEETVVGKLRGQQRCLRANYHCSWPVYRKTIAGLPGTANASPTESEPHAGGKTLFKRESK
jgi:hypothetical protein